MRSFHPGGMGSIELLALALRCRFSNVASVTIFVASGKQEAQSRTKVCLLLGFFDKGKFGMLRRLIVQRLQVNHVENGLTIALGPLVESAARLIAKQFRLKHTLKRF